MAARVGRHVSKMQAECRRNMSKTERKVCAEKWCR